MNKKINPFIFTFLMLLSGCNFGNNISYKVNVLLPDGTVAKNIEVEAYDGTSVTKVKTNNEGIASFNLSKKDYSVYIYDQGYALKAGTIINDSNNDVTVTLSKLSTINVGEGDMYNPYIINEGVYEATTNGNEITYYGFRPTKPGKYIIESWANPTIDAEAGFYGNNDQYVSETPIIQDSNSGAEFNFSFELNISIEEFINTGTFDSNGNLIYEKDSNGNYIPGGSYKIGISNKVLSSTVKFPISIKWVDNYERPKVEAQIINVEEKLTQFEDNTSSDLIYLDAKLNGLTNVFYNENDGFYHVDNENGYVLVAKISEPCPYLDKAFSKVNENSGENEGILATTSIIVDNGTKDYSNFVREYEKYCNNDGVYPVTNELKTFLEYYYLNIKDWIISQSLDVVDDEYGWLFACGYYANIADSYDKPWSGTGTSEDSYSINMGQYYVKIVDGETIYYSYSLKNTVNEVTMFVNIKDPNAKIIYDGNEYSSEEGAYVEVSLGGMSNPGWFMIGVSTVDGSSASFVMKLAEKENAVPGDQITLGENTVFVEKNGMVECSYKVLQSGSYTFTCEEKNALIEDKNGNVYSSSDGVISFTYDMKANEYFTFNIYTINMEEEYITFKLEMLAKIGVNRVDVKAYETREYPFVAPEKGTYAIECLTTNTVISIERNGVVETKYGDSNDKKFILDLAENEQIILLLSTANYKKDTVSFSITKL